MLKVRQYLIRHEIQTNNYKPNIENIPKIKYKNKDIDYSLGNGGGLYTFPSEYNRNQM